MQIRTWGKSMPSNFYGSTLFVTGATGQLGKALSRRILQDGYQLRIMVRDPRKAEFLALEGAQVVTGDLTDPASLCAAVQGCQIILHLAGAPNHPTQKNRFNPVNVSGTRALAEAAMQAGVEQFVYVSCAQVYSSAVKDPIDEFSKLQHSDDPYIESKVQAELILREMAARFNFPVVIAQPTLIYGPGMETGTMKPLRMIAAGRLVLPDHGKGLLHPLYIDDAVDGILGCAQAGEPGQAYILCGSEIVTTADFFAHYAQMIGNEPIPTVSASQALREATLGELSAKVTGKPPNQTRLEVQLLLNRKACNGAKAYYNLGFIPAVQLEEGMRRVKDWLQQQVNNQITTRAFEIRSDYSSSTPPPGL
jgi:nucleoside-diphosphate-sugar epimerase